MIWATEQLVLSCGTVYYKKKSLGKLTVMSVEEILMCNHWNESYWSIPSFGAFKYAMQGGPDFWVL